MCVYIYAYIYTHLHIYIYIRALLKLSSVNAVKQKSLPFQLICK